MPTNKTVDVADIVVNPEKYGFSWYTDKVQKGDLGPWDVPLVKHNDVDLLRATFGDSFFLASADGTSRHVTNQRIARDAKSERPLTTAETIKTAIVQNMLGMKSKRTVVKETWYVFGGQKFAALAEAQDFARKVLTEKGLPEEMIEDLVATAVQEVK